MVISSRPVERPWNYWRVDISNIFGYRNTFAKILGSNFGSYILWLLCLPYTIYALDFAVLHANFKIGEGIVIVDATD